MHASRSKVSVVALLILLTACVSTKNIQISDDSTAKLKDADIGGVFREKPDFAAMTAGKVMFGAIGAMISAGNRIIRENDVQDPANYIGQVLLKRFAEKHQLVINTNNSKKAASEDVIELAEQFGDMDLLLDIRTINWSIGYFPTDWDNYRVIYTAKLRLIDTRSKKLLAQGFCSRVPEKSDDAPTREQLLANKAQRLKSELKTAAEYCINHFSDNVLRIQG